MRIQIQGTEVTLPDFLVAGASRSGTTSLHYALNQHPEISMSSVKEPFFFNGPFFKNHNVTETAITTLEGYVKLFEKSSRETLGESTSAYLYSFETVIPNLRQLYGDKYRNLKIILVLRDPAERAFSHYRLFVRDSREDLEFEEAIKDVIIAQRKKQIIGYDYVGFGMYYAQVKAFRKHFPHLKVFLYDDFKTDNLKVIKEIFRFLHVDDLFVPDISLQYNVGGRVKMRWLHDFVFFQKSLLKDFLKPFIPYDLEIKIRHKIIEQNAIPWQMPPDVRKKLLNIYKEDIVKLQDLLNRDLSMWQMA